MFLQKQNLIWLPLPICRNGIIGLCVMDLWLFCAVFMKEWLLTFAICISLSELFHLLWRKSSKNKVTQHPQPASKAEWDTFTFPNPCPYLHHLMSTVLVLRCLRSAKRKSGQQTLQDKKTFFFQIPTVRSWGREILDRWRQMRGQRIRHRTLRPQGLGPTQLPVN